MTFFIYVSESNVFLYTGSIDNYSVQESLLERYDQKNNYIHIHRCYSNVKYKCVWEKKRTNKKYCCKINVLPYQQESNRNLLTWFLCDFLVHVSYFIV